jgi:biotin carboxyl carrier protein
VSAVLQDDADLPNGAGDCYGVPPVTIKSQVDGPLMLVPVNEGQTVRQGQVLAG